jgi:hypothetical protein
MIGKCFFNELKLRKFMHVMHAYMYGTTALLYNEPKMRPAL